MKTAILKTIWKNKHTDEYADNQKIILKQIGRNLLVSVDLTQTKQSGELVFEDLLPSKSVGCYIGNASKKSQEKALNILSENTAFIFEIFGYATTTHTASYFTLEMLNLFNVQN